MWLFLLAIISSTSLWAAGVDYYHWKDLELPHADKDRLFINYQMLKDYRTNFPVIRLYKNTDMKGDPAFEFTSRGTLEKGELKCAIDNFGCQHGPIYKRPWGHRDGGHYAVYFPIEKHIDDTNFEIKYGGQSYFLSLSELKDYKAIVLKPNSTDHQHTKNYWIQKSHPYLIQKIKEKMPNFEAEKKKAVECLRSTKSKCTENYSIESSLASIKENIFDLSDLSGESDYVQKLKSFDYSNKNMNARNALANCLENGKILTGVYTNPVDGVLTTTADFYSNAQIDFIEGEKLKFECSFSFKTDKVGVLKETFIWFSHQLDI